jgi:hypothetical protein
MHLSSLDVKRIFTELLLGKIGREQAEGWASLQKSPYSKTSKKY